MYKQSLKEKERLKKLLRLNVFKPDYDSQSATEYICSTFVEVISTVMYDLFFKVVEM